MQSKNRLKVTYFLLIIALFKLNSYVESSSLSEIRLSVDENLPPNVIVGALGRDKISYEDTLKRDKNFTFVLLDSGELQIRTRTTLDREKCPEEFFENHQCVIAVPLIYSNGYSDVLITINDVDDNKPKFEKERLNLWFPENTMVGSKFPVDQAFDDDSPANGVLDYELREVNVFDEDAVGVFRLDKWTRQGDGAIMPRLELVRELDYELIQNYSLELIAVGAEYHSVLPITILVQDINDNSPQFGHSNLHALIPEDAKVGSIVSSVEATDIDSGENGRIEFKFSVESMESTGYFEIDKDTGNIYLRESLENKGGTKHSITIIAKDCGEKPQTDMMNWNFEIEDINDFKPEIKFRPTGGCYRNGSSYLIPENYGEDSGGGRNKVLGIFTVDDEDKGLFGDTQLYMLNGSEYFELVSTRSNSYLFRQKFSFDHEEEPTEFALMFTAHDCASAIQTATYNCSRLVTNQTIVFEIADENDNWPRFEQHSYEAYLTEEESIRELIQVVAYDEDSGLNGELVYSISSKNQASSFLKIDSKTGWISTVTPLDREQLGSEIDIFVRASDLGSPPKHADTKYRIHLSDTNDNPPKFQSADSQTYRLELRENEPAGAWVGNIDAIDPDTDNSDVYYEYEPIYQSDRTLFRIDRTTGKVFSLYEFDFEEVANQYSDYKEQGYFLFKVRATEETRTLRIGHDGHSEIEVQVRITDDNDNPPQIDFTRTEVNAIIPWDAYKKYPIVQVFARDRDTSCKLTYQIRKSSASHRFQVDKDTGEVFTKNDLGVYSDIATSDQDYTITVQVSDGQFVAPVQIFIRLSANWTLFNHSMAANENKITEFANFITEIPRIALYLTALVIFVVLSLICVWVALIIRFRGSTHRRMRREKKNKQIAMDITLPYHHTHNHLQLETKRISDASSGLYAHPYSKQNSGVKYGNGHLSDQESPTDSQLMSSHTMSMRNAYADADGYALGQQQFQKQHQLQVHDNNGNSSSSHHYLSHSHATGGTLPLPHHQHSASAVYTFQMPPSATTTPEPNTNSLTLTKGLTSIRQVRGTSIQRLLVDRKYYLPPITYQPFSRDMAKFCEGRKGSRNAPPVVEFGDHREQDFWLPRSLDSQKNSSQNIYSETDKSGTAPLMRIQRPGNICNPNRSSAAIVSEGDPRSSPLVVPRSANRGGDTAASEGGSPTSSCGKLINPSNQILQPPSSGHEKWNLPRDNSFRHAHSNSQSSTATIQRQRNSMDLDTIDEDLQSINMANANISNNSGNNNNPSANLPDLCQDVHHSSLEKQQQQNQQPDCQRHGSLPNAALYLAGSDSGTQLTTVGRTAIV